MHSMDFILNLMRLLHRERGKVIIKSRNSTFAVTYQNQRNNIRE